LDECAQYTSTECANHFVDKNCYLIGSICVRLPNDYCQSFSGSDTLCRENVLFIYLLNELFFFFFYIFLEILWFY
jgi:hypothetical protein